VPEPISIEGPIELVDGELCLCIPLDVGGAELAPLARGIGEVKGDVLVVTIPAWMAVQFEIAEGSLMVVDNANGKFTFTRSAKNGPFRGGAI
jgi:hypothetical protein